MNIPSARQRRIFWRQNRRKILITIYVFISYFLILLMVTHFNQASEKIISPIPASDIVHPKEAGQSAHTKFIQPTPTPITQEQMIKSLPNGSIVWKTYGHESTYGKFDACKSQGLFNGFGFAQNDFGYQCFSSLQEVASKVSDWFALHLQTMTTKQALCYYNTGTKLDDCGYAEYTLSL